MESKQKVWRFLGKTKPGERYLVAKLAKPENREAFMAAIKEYMASMPYNGWISFNSDFTKFYRTALAPKEELRNYRKDRLIQTVFFLSCSKMKYLIFDRNSVLIL